MLRLPVDAQALQASKVTTTLNVLVKQPPP
jgi:hypothetical protein